MPPEDYNRDPYSYKADYSGHPLYTEYRPVSYKEAYIGIFLGVLLFLSFFIYASMQ